MLTTERRRKDIDDNGGAIGRIYLKNRLNKNNLRRIKRKSLI